MSLYGVGLLGKSSTLDKAVLGKSHRFVKGQHTTLKV